MRCIKTSLFFASEKDGTDGVVTGTTRPPKSSVSAVKFCRNTGFCYDFLDFSKEAATLVYCTLLRRTTTYSSKQQAAVRLLRAAGNKSEGGLKRAE